MTTEISRKVAKLQQLRNVRFHQTGSKAASTQRKLDALYRELSEVLTHSELTELLGN